MKDKIISLETAKLAKEKGFKHNSKCYGGNGEILENIENHTNNIMQRFRYEAPTQSLLQKWLREKHEIHIIVEPMIKQYNSRIFKWGLFKSRWRNTCRNRDSYEEALEISLQKGLKLIK